MSLTKRIKGDFTIETVDATDTISLVPGVSGAVVVAGDLTVQGTTTTVESSDLVIVDNVIVLNSGEAGPGITHIDGTAGIEISRGDGVSAGHHPAGIRFSEALDIWQVMNGDDAETWVSVVTGSAIANVVEDTSPQLGGNLDVNGWTITSTNASDGTSGANGADIIIAVDPTGLVKFEQELTLKEQTTPALEAGYSKIYASAPVDGGSGLHYVNDAGTDDELVSKKKAITYGLIF